MVHVSPHTSGASHILDHRESLFRPAKPLAMLSKMTPVTVSRERSSHVPRSIRQRRQGTRADDHVSARRDTDSILHVEIRRKENASRAFERILTLGPENLQTVLSRHCCGLKCAQMPCVAFCVFLQHREMLHFFRIGASPQQHGEYCTEGDSCTHNFLKFGINQRLHLHRAPRNN